MLDGILELKVHVQYHGISTLIEIFEEVLSVGRGIQNLENESKQVFFKRVEKLLRRQEIMLATDKKEPV